MFESVRPSEAPVAPPSDIGLKPRVVAERAQIDAQSRNPLRSDCEGRCRVLLVDDDDILRAYVANLLEGSGYRFGEAASGEKALRALRGGDYGIVITDWKMPGMNGLELCRELRAGIANRDLYVLMLTASDRPEDVELYRVAGADAYVLKSAPNEEIIARMTTARHIAQLRWAEHCDAASRGRFAKRRGGDSR